MAEQPSTLQTVSRLLSNSETTLSVGLLTGLVVMLVPLVEEVFVRGALFGIVLRRDGLATAMFSTSLIFVLLHGSVRDFPSLLVVALVLGYLRAASGSLLPSLGLHVAFNMVGILMLVTGINTPMRAIDVPPVVHGFCLMLVGGLCYAAHQLSQRGVEAAEARREDQE